LDAGSPVAATSEWERFMSGAMGGSLVVVVCTLWIQSTSSYTTAFGIPPV
jgi:hypothetical protein